MKSPVKLTPIWLVVVASLTRLSTAQAGDLHYSVSWLGNSFSGASNTK